MCVVVTLIALDYSTHTQCIVLVRSFEFCIFGKLLFQKSFEAAFLNWMAVVNILCIFLYKICSKQNIYTHYTDLSPKGKIIMNYSYRYNSNSSNYFNAFTLFINTLNHCKLSHDSVSYVLNESYVSTIWKDDLNRNLSCFEAFRNNELVVHKEFSHFVCATHIHT